MNVQAHMSGQISGQAANQGGLPQQNGNLLQPAQMQSLGVGGASAAGGPPHTMSNMDPDLHRTREYMRGKIIDVLKLRNQLPITEASMIKFRDFARRLEEGLFKIAHTKEDYTNLSTLEHRLQILLRGSRNVHNQRHPQLVNSASASAPVGTMIPTPGISHSGNPSIVATSSIDKSTSAASASIAPTNINTGSLLPSSGMTSASFTRSEGNISNGYQQLPANFPLASGGISSIGVQRMASQMIPTPGFNSNNNNGSINDQSSNNVGLSTVESTMVSQPQQQKPHGGQNSRILRTLGSQMGSGIRSGLQQKAFGLPHGSLNGALGMMGNNMHIVSEHGTPVGYQTTTAFASSPKPLQQNFDQHQLPVMQADGYGMNNADSFGSGNLYGAVTSVGSVTNSQNLNSVNLQAQIPGNISHEQPVQEEFRQRTSGPDKAQCNNISADGSTISPMVDARSSSEPFNSRGAISKSENGSHDRQYRNQVKWLLFLRHARSCKASEGKCDSYCFTVRKLLSHMNKCESSQCSYPRCRPSKILIRHYKTCTNPTCPVCVPVKNFIQAQKAHACRNSASVLPSSDGGSTKINDAGDISTRMTSRTASNDASVGVQPSQKRMKIEQSSQSVIAESEGPLGSVVAEPHISQDIQHQDYQHVDRCMLVKPEPMEVKTDVPVSCSSGNPVFIEMKDDVDDISKQKIDREAVTLDEFGGLPMQESAKFEKEPDSVKQENVTESSESAAGTKSGKPKIKGVSLTELFTPEQVREHITGLRRWVGQSKAKAEKNQAMEHSMSENSCQLCAVERLTFEPPPIYCSPCGARIKRNAMYYTMGAGDTRHYFCIPCHNEARGDSIVVDGTAIPKARLEKKKNDEEIEEWWVQCDKCEAWQHQICALFNGRRNDGGQAEYTCPNCYITEVERGERKPLPQSAVLGAKDLPRTILSDHIEQRLFKRLKQERQERARVQGKSYDEVPGAESLVIRVVSSVDKKLEVKQRFLEIFQEQNYPLEFPYKSKVVLLFQKIEGVEVCLFGMYVQEFGSECAFPNQRRVYLSYLDSVKYFRPEVKAVTGEALRTFVYHEILIGYLEYCKKRGFTSCYIWACPPLKGEDYILYCHPEIQKTPKSDKLREWYLAMLRKASKENIVVDLTNLYDHFFVTTGECKAKVTAARLPYFDGDYWPGAAEDLINQFRLEEDGRKLNKKGTIKKTITKRALKASGQSDLSANASKDLLLMHKLGETICPMREDFIMVHLQHCCTHCCILMVSGNRWVCNQCKKFQICDKCHEAELKRDERERHPFNQREKHVLYPIEITDVPTDTTDQDDILESEFFDTRQAFLSLCQGNHYQYDTLRRAKHSSMMVLYHLHNPTAPAFVTPCCICHLDIETGQGWRCEVCPDYDVCNACYKKDGGIDHPHKLTNHPSMAERDAQNKEARQLRVLQLRKMLDLLVHASQCRSAHCQYPNCRKVKGLFRHGIQCKTRASGGCLLCKKMWYLLQLHARACKESQCHVPRCRDLKEHLRRLQQQSDSRRRAAVMEMMRQRAAEVAGSSG
ncbi:Histone acetyltransferase HAC1 -like protein [Gossypium arboreum]|uniref:histone acetyltransferase n=1 Tax=Gossypium arboreum TaxID=29729 RepID=A0A0B0P8R6_GOSAR|nr:Histone acetyltransferase HAC1 -like protein [Gossypium arboreum]